MHARQYSCKPAGSQSQNGGILTHDDIHQFLRQDDDFPDRLALQERLHLFGGYGRGLQVRLGSAGGHFDDVAEFAVDLNGDFERVLDEQGRVELRPGGVGEARAAACASPSAVLQGGRVLRGAWPRVLRPGAARRAGAESGSRAGRQTGLVSQVIASLMKTIRAEMAVLKRRPSRSSVTFLMQAWSALSWAAVGWVSLMPGASRMFSSSSGSALRFGGQALLEFGLALLVHEQAPHAPEKAIDALPRPWCSTASPSPAAP